MSCVSQGCPNPTGRQSHCAGCHLTFSGITAFDSHRVNFACKPPADLKHPLEQRPNGVWGLPSTGEEWWVKE